jgi:DNA-binding CsgD family transcriptional regulator
MRDRATERELVVVAAVLEAGSEKAAAHRLGLSHSTVKHHLASARSRVGAATTAQLVWILGARLPEPRARAQWANSGLCEGTSDALHPQGGPERPVRATASSGG